MALQLQSQLHSGDTVHLAHQLNTAVTDLTHVTQLLSDWTDPTASAIASVPTDSGPGLPAPPADGKQHDTLLAQVVSESSRAVMLVQRVTEHWRGQQERVAKQELESTENMKAIRAESEHHRAQAEVRIYVCTCGSQHDFCLCVCVCVCVCVYVCSL